MMDTDQTPAQRHDHAAPSNLTIHVSAPAVVHIAIRAAAVFLIATWLASFASTEFWAFLDGGPHAENHRAAYAITVGLSLAMAVLMWVGAPFIAGFVKPVEEESRRPFDLTDGLTLVIVWLGLSNVMLSAVAFLRAFVAWIGAGGFRSTPEELPLQWFGESLTSAFATGVVGLVFLLSAGPVARWLAKLAARR